MNITRLFLAACFLISSFFASAANIYSRASGAWSSGSSWSSASCGGSSCACVPAAGDVVYICAGNSITRNSDLVIGGGAGSPSKVIIYGSLDMSGFDLAVRNGGSLEVYGSLYAKNAQFDNGSLVLFDSGSSASFYSLDNKNNSNGVVVNGMLSVSGDLTNGSGGAISGNGIIFVEGSASGAGTIFGEPTSGTNVAFGATALPIELLYFEGEEEGGCVALRWATASESGNDYFEVAKSLNGYGWTLVAIVDGAMDSSSERGYSMKDCMAYRGISYYRLAQVDTDGDKEFFDIISVAVYHAEPKKIARIINMLGQDTYISAPGLKVAIYEDGTAEKIFSW